METLTDKLQELNIKLDEFTTPEMAELLKEIIKKIDELCQSKQ